MAVSVEVSPHGVELARYQRLLDTLGRSDHKADLLDTIGTFAESYINPDIMKMFLNKVCNIV